MMKFLRDIFFLITLSTCVSSCESVMDGENDDPVCNSTYYMRFIYDMNMDFADAFDSQVSSVELYIFNSKTGDLVKKMGESGAALAQDGYRMELDLKPGSYTFVAWCGLTGNGGQFTVASSVSSLGDVTCQMARSRAEGLAIQQSNLSPLFHGTTSATLIDDSSEHVYTIRLTKNTNNINISLQNVDGSSLDVDRFAISMVDNNGHMAHDNALLEDEDISYRPFRQLSGSADVASGRSDDGRQNVVKAELSTARLMANHNPKIEITDTSNGESLYSIPIVEWALMLKSSQYASLGSQEYLDREDTYNVVLYLQKGSGDEPEDPDQPNDPDREDQFVVAAIYINGWRLVINGGVVL